MAQIFEWINAAVLYRPFSCTFWKYRLDMCTRYAIGCIGRLERRQYVECKKIIPSSSPVFVIARFGRLFLRRLLAIATIIAIIVLFLEMPTRVLVAIGKSIAQIAIIAPFVRMSTRVLVEF